MLGSNRTRQAYVAYWVAAMYIIFSILQQINQFMDKDSQMWMLKFQERMEQAKRYVEFCAKVYKFQIDNGRYFLHEHPYLATSWGLDCIAKLMNREDVTRVLTHMCQFGMTSRAGGKGSEFVLR